MIIWSIIRCFYWGINDIIINGYFNIFDNFFIILVIIR